MKKFIGFLLCLALLLGNFSIVASAFSSEEATPASTPDAEAITPSEALNKLENAYENEAQSSDVEEERPIYEYASFYADVSHIQTSNDGYGIYPMQMRSIETYDYAIVRFCADTSVTLTSYQSVTVPYSDEEVVVPIGFTCTLPSNGDFISDYHAIETADVLMLVDVYIGDEIVQTIEASIDVFATAQGAFASHHGKFYSYSAYIDDMLAKELIDQAMYKSAVKRMTRVPALSANESTATAQTTLASSVQSLNSNTYRIYNAETETLETITELSSFAGGREENNGQNGETSFTELPPTRIIITRSISYNSATSKYTVSGTVQWSDISGNFHAAKSILVKLMDEEVLVDDEVGNAYTDEDGFFSISFDKDHDAFQNGADLYLRLEMASDAFVVCDGVGSGPYKDVYYIETETQSNVTGSSTATENASYGYNPTTFTEDIHRVHDSISIHQALVVGYHYFDAMEGKSQREASELQGLKAHLLKDENQSYSSRNDGIFIGEYSYFNWDEILHELGHQASYHLGNYTNLSGNYPHIIEEDQSVRYGRSVGIPLAWNEGWANFFAIAAQLYYSDSYSQFSWPLNAGDKAYSTFVTQGRSVSLSQTTTDDYEDAQSYGESNELAIALILIDLIDNTPEDDMLFYNHLDVWNIMKNEHPKSLYELTQSLSNIAAPLDPFFNQIGQILEKAGVVPICNNEKIFTPESDSHQIWVDSVSIVNLQYNNYPSQYKYFITFFTPTFEKIMTTESILLEAEESHIFELNEDQCQQLVSSAIDGFFYWCIAIESNTDKSRPDYSLFYSAFFTGHVSTKITENTLLTDTLGLAEEKWYSFQASNDGQYAFYLTNDSPLNITFAIIADNTMPILDKNVLLNPQNCHILEISANKTIYFKVDPQNDQAIYSIKVAHSPALEKQSSLQSVQDSEHWFSFKAPKQGKYIFFSSEAIDSHATLYSSAHQTNQPNSPAFLAEDIDSLDENNFLIECELSKDETVYLKVKISADTANNTNTIFVHVTYIVKAWTLHQQYNEHLAKDDYIVVSFKPAAYGSYTFFTTGNVDTYMELFSSPPTNGTSTDNLLTYSNFGASGTNAAITYTVSPSSTVFLRIKVTPYNESAPGGNIGIAVTTSTLVHATGVGFSERVAMDAPIWYCFTAQTAGRYVFYTTGDSDTVGEIFSLPVPNNSTEGLLAGNDEGGQGDTPFNFRIIYTMTAGQTVYIRVSEGVPFGNGLFTFYVEPY